MVEKKLGPRQAAKKGNERFAEEETTGNFTTVKPEDAGRDVSDEESGVAGILRKADGGGAPALKDNGHDEDRDREYRAPEE